MLSIDLIPETLTTKTVQTSYGWLPNFQDLLHSSSDPASSQSIASHSLRNVEMLKMTFGGVFFSISRGYNGKFCSIF